MLELPIYVVAMLKKAQEVRLQAEAGFSGYLVAAAVCDEYGNIHIGCNVENDACTGSHAEYGAIGNIFVATPRGHTIQAVVVATEDGGPPCGGCRQHIWQFCGGNKEVPIYCIDVSAQITSYTIGELLPYAFELRRRA
jgi:cytidine deaminase